MLLGSLTLLKVFIVIVCLRLSETRNRHALLLQIFVEVSLDDFNDEFIKPALARDIECHGFEQNSLPQVVEFRRVVLDRSRWSLVRGQSKLEQFSEVSFEEGVAGLGQVPDLEVALNLERDWDEFLVECSVRQDLALQGGRGHENNQVLHELSHVEDPLVGRVEDRVPNVCKCRQRLAGFYLDCC